MNTIDNYVFSSSIDIVSIEIHNSFFDNFKISIENFLDLTNYTIGEHQIITNGYMNLNGTGVQEIHQSAFYGLSITHAFVPVSCITFNYQIFGHCEELTSVIIEYPLSVIPDSTFIQCSKLSNISIGGKILLQNGILDFSESPIRSIGYSAFQKCNQITKIVFPEGDISASFATFGELPELRIIEFRKVPSTLKITYSFWGTYQIKCIHFPSLYPCEDFSL